MTADREEDATATRGEVRLLAFYGVLALLAVASLVLAIVGHPVAATFTGAAAAVAMAVETFGRRR
jgi:hypothetical protein